MREILNVGDIVSRKSYNNDLVFKIINIKGEIADLAGITVRIAADANIRDLVKLERNKIDRILNENDELLKVKINRSYSRICCKSHNSYNSYYNPKSINKVIREDLNEYTNSSTLIGKQYKKPGVILHLDGDKEYTDKCRILYSRMGLVNYVYHIPESEQSKYVYNLLEKIKPNILVVTGHDAFSKRSSDIYNINSYKNSKYFVESVNEARRYDHNMDSLVIYAGACQSYYEALITAGANFASSPKRVLIDIMDPIIVAQAIAYTPVDNYISLANIIANTREGIKGIGGMQTKGQCREGLPAF
ncbi:MAG: sporulation peptidase YabG [Clostridia bacterium]